MTGRILETGMVTLRARHNPAVFAWRGQVVREVPGVVSALQRLRFRSWTQ